MGTGSMMPLMNGNADVLVVQPEINEVREGDIIIFQRPDEEVLIGHRVIDIYTDNKTIVYKTKGDANPTEDSYLVKYEDIRGLVIGIIY